MAGIFDAETAATLAENPVDRTRLENILLMIKLLAETGQRRCQIGLKKDETLGSEIWAELAALGFGVIVSAYQKRTMEIHW